MATLTLSVNAGLLEVARERAFGECTTVEAKLCQWLREYAGRAATPEETEEIRRRVEKGMATLDYLRKKYPVNGRKFTREEMNERR